MFERFTSAARETVIRARDEALILHHDYVGTEHVLLALSAPQAGSPSTVLCAAGLEAGEGEPPGPE